MYKIPVKLLNKEQLPWTEATISSPIVDFRLLGPENKVRRFNGRIHSNQDAQLAIKRAQAFVNEYCLPIVRFDGANTKRVQEVIGGSQVDWFIQHHEWKA